MDELSKALLPHWLALTWVRKWSLLLTNAALIGGLMIGNPISAQTFKVVSSKVGDLPLGLTLLDRTLFGTAVGQGGDGGKLFSVDADGRNFRTVYPSAFPYAPYGTVLLAGNTLYGTMVNMLDGGQGTLFAINIGGTGFTNLHYFSRADGFQPYAGLVLSSNTLYGTTEAGGIYGAGMVFAINTDGSGFTNLHSFNGNDGRVPMARLVVSSNALYGVTLNGGSSGSGNLFAINTDGSGFTVLHDFANTSSDGGLPSGELVLSGTNLYGTTMRGGGSEIGTVFALNIDGTGYTILHSFSKPPNNSYTNSDGMEPAAGLIVSGHTLYGTASGAGAWGGGTVFCLNTDGTGFRTLHNFTSGADGAHPIAGLVLLDNALYGTTVEGGESGQGTIFTISFLPELTIAHSALNVIVSWPTDFAGFDYSGYTLQTTTNLASIWATNLPTSVVNGQYTVTKPIGGTQFFRLSR